MKDPKLILRDIKKSAVAVVYGFTTPLRRDEMMIEILNFTFLND